MCTKGKRALRSPVHTLAKSRPRIGECGDIVGGDVRALKGYHPDRGRTEQDKPCDVVAADAANVP